MVIYDSIMPITVKFGVEECTMVPIFHARFGPDEGREMGTGAPKIKKKLNDVCFRHVAGVVISSYNICGIISFIVYLTACNLEKSLIFEKAVETRRVAVYLGTLQYRLKDSVSHQHTQQMTQLFSYLLMHKLFTSCI